MEEIQTNVLIIFLLAIHTHLYIFALRFLFFKLTQPLTISTVQLLYTVKEKGGKPDRKPYHLSYGLRNPYRNLKSENPKDYGQKPHKNLYVHEFGFNAGEGGCGGAGGRGEGYCLDLAPRWIPINLTASRITAQPSHRKWFSIHCTFFVQLQV